MINRCLAEMKKHEATIRSYCSYEIMSDSDDLALVMMLDGCFILYLLLETKMRRAKQPSSIHCCWSKIRSFIIIGLRKILAKTADVGVELEGNGVFPRYRTPRNRTTPILTNGLEVLHLLNLFYMSRLLDAHPFKSSSPVWALPSASELLKSGIVLEKNKLSKIFL